MIRCCETCALLLIREFAEIWICMPRANRVTLVVDHMINSTVADEISDIRISKLDSWSIWRRYCWWLPDYVISEVRVDCNSISFEWGNLICDFESNIASFCKVRLSYISRKKRLIQINLSIVPVPLNEITEGLFWKKSIYLNAISVDL